MKFLVSLFYLACLALPSVGLGEEYQRGTRQEAQAMVEAAIAYFDEVGSEAAFEKFNHNPAPEFRDRDLHVVVFAAAREGTIVAHSHSGEGQSPIGGANANCMVCLIMLNTLENNPDLGYWHIYEWVNLITGQMETKSSWARLHQGYVFLVGSYKAQ